MRQVNTSNSIVLMQSDLDQYVVHDDLSSTIELLPCIARTSRVNELLSDTCFAGMKNEKNIAGKVRSTYNRREEAQ